jgi:Domain of unknown function (DUF1839)
LAGPAEGDAGVAHVVNAVMPPIADPSQWQRHALHAAARDWPETNCYTDLWIALLHARRLEPTAMLGFLVEQDWEGDQFTFFKPPPGTLRLLYGASLDELALYEDLEAHVAEQLRRGRTVLVEVDAWFLPDVAGTAYQREHTKTTIGILGLDRAARQLRYLHNSGLFALDAEDYDGVLGTNSRGGALFPYAEAVRFTPGGALDNRALRDAATGLLLDHLQRRRPGNPVRDFMADLPRHLEALARRDADALHRFSFNTLRQLGAASELLASHLRWLAQDTKAAADAALLVSSGAKSLQFVLARQLRRGDTDMPVAMLQRIAAAYDAMIEQLGRGVA